MAYFSLLFETKPQEEEAGLRAEQHIKCKKRKDKEKNFIFIGSRMVLLEDEEEAESIPGFSQDLCIDQIMDYLFPNGINEHIKKVFYGFPLGDSLIRYRQEMFEDLENDCIFQILRKYWADTNTAARLLDYSGQTDIPIQKSKYLIDAAVLYFNGVMDVINKLDGKAISKAFKNMIEIFKTHMEDASVKAIYERSSLLKQKLEEINCTFLLDNNAVEVKWEKISKDYCDRIGQVFGNSYSNKEIRIFPQVAMTSLEIKLMELCEKEYGTLFQRCKEFAGMNPRVLDPFTLKLNEELNIIFSVKNMFDRLKEKGFPITYPYFIKEQRLQLKEVYDLALACKAERASQVITNEFILKEGERGAWVTGANQGGKTTFARSIGQSIYFALLGFQVPASDMALPYYQGIYTYFSFEENAVVSNGKLKEELLHLKKIVELAPPYSFFILNELFSSTAALDAFEMSRLFIKKLQKIEGTVLSVTHVPSLAAECTGMVSLAASDRSFHITRKNAELSAHAKDIAEKFELCREQIKERINNDYKVSHS